MPFEYATSIMSCKLGDDPNPYYVVGTVIIHPDESKPKTGRLTQIWCLLRDCRYIDILINRVSLLKISQVGDKPALPVKRSKSMKSIDKPVSVILVPLGCRKPSFIMDHVRYG